MPHKDKQREKEYRRRKYRDNPEKPRSRLRRLYHSRLEFERVRQKHKYHKGPGRETARKYYMAHKTAINERMLVRHLRTRYGQTLLEYNLMVQAQKGVCAICKSFAPTKIHPRLCVDHDHSTGKVRGLLCNNCNAGLGFFANSSLRMRGAIAYLAKQS